MSIYNKSNDIERNETNIEIKGDSSFTINMSKFMDKQNAQVTAGNLYLRENVGIQFFTELQTKAFTDKDRNKLNKTANDTTSINYSNLTTTINDNLDLSQSNLILKDESIPISKINMLSNTLEQIQTNLLNINNSDNDIIKLQDITKDHALNISNIMTSNNIQEDQILQNINDMSQCNALILQNINEINANKVQIDMNLGDIVDINLKNFTQGTELIKNSTLINDISANLINCCNTVTSNYSEYIGFETATDNSIENLSNISNNHTDNISINNKKLNGIDISINNIISDISGITTDIININDYNILQDNKTNMNKNTIDDTVSRTMAIETFNVDASKRVNFLETDNINNKNSISVLQTKQSTKQPIINATNKLNMAFIADGSVSNIKISMLNDLNTNISLQTQLNNITNNIKSVDNLENFDLSSISELTTKINNNELQLNSLHTLQTNIDNQIILLKENDATIQNIINSKHLIIDNLLSTVESNIDILNDSKQPLINNLSKIPSSLINRTDNLKFVDVDTSIKNSLQLLNDNITLLQGTDSSLITNIQNNFDTLDNLANANKSEIGLIKSNILTLEASLDDVKNQLREITNMMQSLNST